MRNITIKLIRYFDPNINLYSFNEREEIIILGITSIIMCLFQALYTFSLGLKIDCLILLFFSILITINLFLYKYNIISFKTYCHLYMLNLVIGLNAVNFDAGMISSPSMIWLAIVPICAIIHTGIFWGTIWSINSVVLSITLHLLFQNNIIFFNEFNYQQTIKVSQSNLFTAPLLFFVTFLYYFKKNQNTLAFNQPLVEIGQSTSFIMHEFSKPINRLMNSDQINQEDVRSIIDLYSLAKILSNQNKSNNLSIETIKIDDLIYKILNKYQSFILEKSIQIFFSPSGIEIKTSFLLLEIVIDNLIRNAIENKTDDNTTYIIYIQCSNKNITITNTSSKNNFNSSQPIFGNSTKIGHMGVGLYIVHKIINQLGYKFSIEFNKMQSTTNASIDF